MTDTSPTAVALIDQPDEDAGTHAPLRCFASASRKACSIAAN
jgi:hypothetical protein